MTHSPFDVAGLLQRWAREVGEQGRLDLVPDLVTDPYVVHAADGTRAMTPGEFAEFLGVEFAARPGRRYLVDDYLLTPARIWVRYRLVIPQPDGTPTITSGLQLFRVEGGRLAETWVAFTPPGVDWEEAIPGSPAPEFDEGTDSLDLLRRARLISAWTEDVWHQGRLDLVTECVDARYYRHGADGNRVVTPEGYAGEIRAIRTRLPGIRFAPSSQAVTESAVWSCHRSTATNAETGGEVLVSGLQLYRMRNNRLAETWALTVPGQDWGPREAGGKAGGEEEA